LGYEAVYILEDGTKGLCERAPYMVTQLL